MKKIFLAVMAVAAISFTSCGNKTQQADAEAADSIAQFDALGDAAAEATIDELSAQVDAADAGKFAEVLETVKEKVAELIKTNPEVAKEYVTKVQEYLKENADQIKNVVGDNAAVAAALSAVTEVEPQSVVNGLLEQVDNAAANATEDAKEAVEEKVEDAKEAVKDAGEAVKDAAKEKASEAVDKAADKVKGKLGL